MNQDPKDLESPLSAPGTQILITNTGNANLIISSVIPGCGCTVADYTKEPVKPKHTGKVSITFNSKDKKGQQRKRISVQANTYPAETVLWFTANVEEP